METENNRKIYKADRFYSKCGTHKYNVLFTGDWTADDLITALDNGCYDNPSDKDLIPHHFGGRVEGYRVNNDGTQTATVCVYYD